VLKFVKVTTCKFTGDPGNTMYNKKLQRTRRQLTSSCDDDACAYRLNAQDIIRVSFERQEQNVNSGYRRETDENCALLSYYAANSGNFLPTFRDKLSVPSSRVKGLVFKGQVFLTLLWSLKSGPIGCTKMLVRTYRYSMRNNPE